MTRHPVFASAQLFRGRGDHPKQGRLKPRLHPDGVSINCGATVCVPKCHVVGQCWADVQHDNTVQWLAKYKDEVTENEKPVALAAAKVPSPWLTKRALATPTSRSCVSSIVPPREPVA